MRRDLCLYLIFIISFMSTLELFECIGFRSSFGRSYRRRPSFKKPILDWKPPPIRDYTFDFQSPSKSILPPIDSDLHNFYRPPSNEWSSSRDSSNAFKLYPGGIYAPKNIDPQELKNYLDIVELLNSLKSLKSGNNVNLLDYNNPVPASPLEPLKPLPDNDVDLPNYNKPSPGNNGSPVDPIKPPADNDVYLYDYKKPSSRNNIHLPDRKKLSPDNNAYNTDRMGKNKKDYSRSALELYIRYPIAGLTYRSNNNSANYVAGDISAYPQYSFVQHYHNGNRPISKEVKVEAGVRKVCENITFCMPNTRPLCMTNGTVYCISSLESTITCNESSPELKCVNSTIILPCDANSANCNGTYINTTTISIPCVATIDAFGDFAADKLFINEISKKSVENEANTTISTDNSTSSQGISNKYCVTVIAEPIAEPEAPLHKSHEEFVKYSSEASNKQEWQIWSDISNTILGLIFV